MNTALKLNKKQLFSLYEKSSELVKKNLRQEFGETFFMTGEVKPVINLIAVKHPKLQNAQVRLIDWETIFDFTFIFRLTLYACLIGIIFHKLI